LTRLADADPDDARGDHVGDRAGASQAGLLHVGGHERIDRYTLGLRFLRDANVTEPERRVVATTRAQVGQGDRPADVSLDSGLARSLLGAWFA